MIIKYEKHAFDIRVKNTIQNKFHSKTVFSVTWHIVTVFTSIDFRSKKYEHLFVI